LTSLTHLVAKGFTQIEIIDYEDTLSLVGRLAFARLCLALVAHWDLEWFQMDIKVIFLNGKLMQDISIWTNL